MSAQPSPAPENRRAERRFPTNAEVQVTIVYPVTPGRFAGRVKDLSKSGLKLAVGTSLPKGSRVQVKFGKVVVYGEVRYCREQDGESYEAGLLIEDVVSGARR